MPTPTLPLSPRGKRIPSHELCPWCRQRRQQPIHGYPDLCERCRWDLYAEQRRIEHETLEIAGVRSQIVRAVNERMQGCYPKRDRRPKARRVPAKYKDETCWACGRHKGDTIPVETLFCDDCRLHP